MNIDHGFPSLKSNVNPTLTNSLLFIMPEREAFWGLFILRQKLPALKMAQSSRQRFNFLKNAENEAMVKISIFIIFFFTPSYSILADAKDTEDICISIGGKWNKKEIEYRRRAKAEKPNYQNL